MLRGHVRGERGGKSNGVEGNTHLCVIIKIGALFKGGHVESGRRGGVHMGNVAHEGSMRGGTLVCGAIFLDDELALGKCPF
jgi:hypothetical protein